VLRFEFAENPQKHVILHRVIRTDKDEFYDEMLQVMDQGRSRQGLVFIHGYNVSFDDAVKRTAQIAHDLEFDGAPICYSWSSRGSLANYTHDMANADATVLALQSFLEETVRRTGNSTIHLIAHSMGNRALLQALDRIAVSDQGNQGMFGQLIMAAPDVSERDFRNRYVVAARQLARAVTLYASSRDRALIASAEIHGHNRAGLAGEHLILVDGVDTIDVSEIDTSLIGHSYYGDHPELIRDLRALVELSRPASQRTWLKQIFSPGGFGYFRFADLLGRTPTDHTTPSERR
jgi:esterase/lipase superfamily enzyme